MTPIDLRLDRVSKRYRIRHEQEASVETGWAAKLQRWRQKRSEFWAVRDVSFEVPTGQSLGIIGHNGAGKSTVLKLLAGVTAPTEGELTIRGRMAALLEVGSGFHPELTGRENVFLSGSILGMRRQEIRSKFDSIVDFADVEEFIDTPIKRYSSGMVVRLGFSVAAHLEPDILLLDEVLAVGDSAFQKKCIERVLSLKNRSTIIFISHDLHAVQQLCDRVLVMSGGQVVEDASAETAIAVYNKLIRFRSSSKIAQAGEERTAEITSLDFVDAQGNPAFLVRTGDALHIRVHYTARSRIRNSGFNILFQDQEGSLHCQFTTWLSGQPLDLEPGQGVVEFACQELSLQPGSYLIDATLDEQGHRLLDWQHRCSVLQVNSGREVTGAFYHPHSWRVVSPQREP
jgi:ABC-type polysaccharide/polyol phosphate transport system ATPase subunit